MLNRVTRRYFATNQGLKDVCTNNIAEIKGAGTYKVERVIQSA